MIFAYFAVSRMRKKRERGRERERERRNLVHILCLLLLFCLLGNVSSVMNKVAVIN